MNKKEELKAIIDALNNFMGKIDSVDEPKQQPKYPEGIISFEHGVGGTSTLSGTPTDEYYQNWCHDFLGCTPKYKIHSVKNSKGEVFTVGDEVVSFDQNRPFKINGFVILHEIFLVAQYGDHNFRIDNIKKVQPQPSWKDQIVAFKHYDDIFKYISERKMYCLFKDGIGFDIDYLLANQHYQIFTVKNKAGVEFSVGDEVYNEGTNERFTIKGFQKAIGFREDLMAYERKDCIYSIEFLTKAEPKKEPLFKTEDGFDVLEGDCPYYIRLSDMFIGQSNQWMKGDIKALDHLFYKEKHNAERYVAENKKSISYKELEKFLDTNYVGAGFLYEDIDSRRRFRAEILNHFKPK